MAKPETRVTVAGEKFDKRDVIGGSGDFAEVVAAADEITAEALEALAAESEQERRLRAEMFARMGHGPHVEAMKARLNQELSDRAGKFMPGSVDRYPYLPRLGRLGSHGFRNYTPTDRVGPGTKDTVNSILRDIPDGKLIMCCGFSSGWGTMPVEDFRIAVKRNQVRLTGQVVGYGANPASRDGRDGVHLVWYGRACGLAFRILEP